MQTSFDAVLVALSTNGNHAIDDHLPRYLVGPKGMVEVVAVAAIGEHTVRIETNLNVEQFYLTAMYVDDDGLPHVSKLSVGGVVRIRGHLSIEAAIAFYNDPANWWAPDLVKQIRNLTYL